FPGFRGSLGSVPWFEVPRFPVRGGVTARIAAPAARRTSAPVRADAAASVVRCSLGTALKRRRRDPAQVPAPGSTRPAGTREYRTSLEALRALQSLKCKRGRLLCPFALGVRSG